MEQCRAQVPRTVRGRGGGGVRREGGSGGWPPGTVKRWGPSRPWRESGQPHLQPHPQPPGGGGVSSGPSLHLRAEGLGRCWSGLLLPSGQEGLGSNRAARKLIFDLPSVSGNLWEEAGGGIPWPLQAIATVIKMAWVRLVYEKLRAEWTPERPKYI